MARTWYRQRRGRPRRLCAGIAGLITIGLLTIGAQSVAAGTFHPCLPGETDFFGSFTVLAPDGSTPVEVWTCVAGGPEIPAPNVPWGSITEGVPCQGLGRGIGKVWVNAGDTGQLLVWMCEEPPPPPPPAPGSVPAVNIGGRTPPAFEAVGPSTRFVPLAPQRVLDTRQAGGSKLAADEVRRVDLGAVLDDTITAVAVNVTAAAAEGPGYLTVWDCASVRPQTSAVNVRTGGTAAAGTVVVVDASHQFCVYTSAAAHLIVDVNGAYTTAGDQGYGFTRLTPRRLHDSRPVPVASGSTTRVQITGVTRTPRAAVLNITAVAPETDGYLTVWPCSIDRPEVSNLNFPANISAIANAVQVAVDLDGSVCIYNSATTAVLVDLSGVYDDAPTGRHYQPATPIRVLDTRQAIGGWRGTIGNGQNLGFSIPPEAWYSVLGTVTLVDPPQAGFLAIDRYMSGSPLSFSTINMSDTTIANMFVSSGGPALSAVAGPTGGEHVLVDLSGYFVAP